MSGFDRDHAGTWAIDPSRSRFGFSVTHAMVSRVRGHFGEFEGTVTIGPDGLRSARVDIAIAIASVHTGHTARDEQLRTNDFFEAERFPTITFASTSAIQAGDGVLVRGSLTIKGTTRTVAISLPHTDLGRDERGRLRAGFEGTHRIDRRDYGLDFRVPLDAGGVLVSEGVQLDFTVGLVRIAEPLA